MKSTHTKQHIETHIRIFTAANGSNYRSLLVAPMVMFPIIRLQSQGEPIMQTKVENKK